MSISLSVGGIGAEPPASALENLCNNGVQGSPFASDAPKPRSTPGEHPGWACAVPDWPRHWAPGTNKEERPSYNQIRRRHFDEHWPIDKVRRSGSALHSPTHRWLGAPPPPLRRAAHSAVEFGDPRETSKARATPIPNPQNHFGAEVADQVAAGFIDQSRQAIVELICLRDPEVAHCERG